MVSDLVRNPQGAVARRVAEAGESHVCTSIVVAAELRYGVARRGSSRLASQVDAILGTLDILPLQSPADVAYGDLRVHLESAGPPIRRERPSDCRASARAWLRGRHR
ncbi:MAG TPA: PIN domain-containing protein [Candidatus Tumulicola sp.]|nr:PIN domain-containing protein [Candidatus Tumulicola sp.]